MLKKILILAVFSISVSFAATTGVSEKHNGVGGWVQGGNSGEVFGLDYKMRLDPIATLDFYFHFHFYTDDNALGLYLAYYWNYYNIIKLPPEVGRMGLYWGPAGGVGWWTNQYDKVGIALRAGVVGGWEWEMPQNIPLEIYVELNPVGEMHIVTKDDDDHTGTSWNLPDIYLRLGLRFWF